MILSEFRSVVRLLSQSLNVIRKLSEKTIQSEDDALHVIELLQKRGPPVVVLSSSNLGDNTSLTGYASCKHGENWVFMPYLCTSDIFLQYSRGITNVLAIAIQSRNHHHVTKVSKISSLCCRLNIVK